MANMTAGQCRKVANGLERWWSKRRLEYSGILSSDLYDEATDTGAVRDCDDFFNESTGNTAPSDGLNDYWHDPFRANATKVMKADVLMIVSCLHAASAADDVGIGEYARRVVEVGLD